MNTSADVIVVGAGVIGCAIARELGRRGAHVRVFESRAIGAGATQASAGVLAPYIEGAGRGPLLDLAVRSLQLYDGFVSELLEDSGVSVEYGRPGTLEIALDEASALRLIQSTKTDLALDSGSTWLDGQVARRLEPSLPSSTLGAVFTRLHGYVAAPQLTEALTWAALRHGAAIETGCRVVGIGRSAGSVVVTTDDGTRWTSDSAVVATGSWAAMSGLSEPALSVVRPVRGQLLKLTWLGAPLRHVLWGPECYVVPWRDGSVLVGATVEDVGFDERATAAGVRDLLGAVCDLLPQAWGATFGGARAGLRPATPDGLPIIGPSQVVEGVILATGHYRNGVLLAPLTASLVADLVLEGRTAPLLQFLHPSRFARGQSP